MSQQDHNTRRNELLDKLFDLNPSELEIVRARLNVPDGILPSSTPADRAVAILEYQDKMEQGLDELETTLALVRTQKGGEPIGHKRMGGVLVVQGTFPEENRALVESALQLLESHLHKPKIIIREIEAFYTDRLSFIHVSCTGFGFRRLQRLFDEGRITHLGDVAIENVLLPYQAIALFPSRMNPKTRECKHLLDALDGPETLGQWLATRGFDTPAPIADGAPALTGPLRDARFLQSGDHPNAPRLMVLWNDFKGQRAIYGKELRAIQKKANAWWRQIQGTDAASDLPHLCLLGCPHFMILFPLNGEPYTRRLRFTPERLEKSEPLRQRFANFTASKTASWLKDTRSSGLGGLRRLMRSRQARREYDFALHLYAGGHLDDEFVQFMSLARRKLAELLLDPNADGLLRDILKHLKLDVDALKTHDALIAHLANRRSDRQRLIAVVDTILLRNVLNRYLERQYGNEVQAQDEVRGLAFGYDDILTENVDIDVTEITRIIEALGASKSTRSRKRAPKTNTQLGLFSGEETDSRASPTAFKSEQSEQDFIARLRETNEHYQQSAGGDLHQGHVATAADAFATYLEDNHAEMYAELLAGTRTDLYSFEYADLDPRAFQSFYEKTIGTDIRINPDTGAAEVTDWHRSRKEQGAYFTDERICTWLVKSTLGRRFDSWLEDLQLKLTEHAKQDRRTSSLPLVRAGLDDLMGWTILDPTCGGGIFLRVAFEYLSKQHDRIHNLLRSRSHLSDADLRTLTSEAPYSAFAPDAAGQWEWHILLHMLYGVDIDIKALNIASNLLTLSSLAYKPNGVCFPSFINTNLKSGNALVTPLAEGERDDLITNYSRDIHQLLDLRAQMRQPNLDRDAWLRIQKKTETIASKITFNYTLAAYADAFPNTPSKRVLERIDQVQPFLYEVEFPEIFFEPDDTQGTVKLRQNPGFAVVVGNPPWEEPAYELKQFLPEFDAEFAALTGNASKKRAKKLLADSDIGARWETFKTSIEDYKALLTSGWYEHQQAPVRGKIPGAHTNLYKYATELAWRLLRPEGYAGLLVDNGLWTDTSAKGLRMMLFDRSRTLEVCGFNNNSGNIFPDIHRSYKFTCTTFQKGGSTDTLQAVFMREELSALETFKQDAATIPTAALKEAPHDTWAIPEIRNQGHWEASRKWIMKPTLDSESWSVDTLNEELNAGRQRGLFVTKKPGLYPLIQGKQFNLFGIHQGIKPDDWLDPSTKGKTAGAFIAGRQERRILLAIADYLESTGKSVKGGKQKAAKKWLKALTGKESLPPEWIRLDWDGYRLAWRDVARNDDRRSLIAGIIPKYIGLSHKAPFIRPFTMTVTSGGVEWRLQYPLPQLLYLAGMLSSFACDSIVRTRLAKTTLTSNMFQTLHVPSWDASPKQRQIAELTARLTCLPADDVRPWADYTELAAAVGLTPEQDGLTHPQERWEAEVELNALAAELYGLKAEPFRFLMDTLFMTPQHRDEHAQKRDQIAAKLPT